MDFEIRMVRDDHPQMKQAKKLADKLPDLSLPYRIASIVVAANNKVIGEGCNQPIPPTGQAQKEHAIALAIRNAKDNGHEVGGSYVYMYGHWDACPDCLQTMKANGIGRLYVVSGAKARFAPPANG